jgi:hypothetical protein
MRKFQVGDMVVFDEEAARESMSLVAYTTWARAEGIDLFSPAFVVALTTGDNLSVALAGRLKPAIVSPDVFRYAIVEPINLEDYT